MSTTIINAAPTPIASPVESRVGFAISQSAPALTPYLDLQVHVLAVIEQSLPARAATAVATEDLVESLLDGEIRLEEQALRSALAQRAEDLLHLLDGL